MDYVDQAFALSRDDKAKAISIYIQCVRELAHKSYRIYGDDPFVDLSSLFGERWLMDNGLMGFECLNAYACANANVAFNYANLRMGADGKFISTAKANLSAKERINNKLLSEYARSMDCLVTATTAEIWLENCADMD
jgi:hypothetical protein